MARDRAVRPSILGLLASVTLWSPAAPAADPCSLDTPAIAAFAAALETGPQGEGGRANVLRRRGEMLYARGRQRLALDDYDAALALAPDAAEVRLARAMLFADQARFEPALVDLDRALELRPNFAEAYVQRGRVRYELGLHRSAVQDFTSAIDLDPGAAAAWLGRADALRDSGQAEPALADYEAALRIAPDDGEIWFGRAVAQHRLDRFDAEQADWSRAIALDPDLFWLYGTAYRHRFLYEEIRSDHRTARLHAPDNAKAYFNRAEAYRYRRQYCRALLDYDRALELRPGYDDAELGRGISLLKLGAAEAAIEALSSVLERAPSQVEAYFYRGLARRAAGTPDAARADFTRAARLAPTNPVVHTALAADPAE
jgi:tetratricopeptide (TPR) repeat protein